MLRPVKILMATHYFASHGGGIEIVAEHLFHRFETTEITWIAGNTTQPPQSNNRAHAVGIRVLNFVEKKIGVPFPIPTPSALNRVRIEVAGADVVLLHDCLYLSNIATFLLAKFLGVPIVVVQHIGLVQYKNHLLRLLMTVGNGVVTRPMLSRADQVVFISEITRRYFSNQRFKREPQVIFNGVDSELYRTRGPGESKAAIRSKYGLPESTPVVLYVGRFVEKKGLSILRRMLEQRPHFTWAFAGWGPLNPESWNATSVRVFSGLGNDSLAGLYRACDVLVLPSTGEGFPLVIQEALASGLPVVCNSETVEADPSMKAFVQGVALHSNDIDRTARDFLQVVDNIVEGDSRVRHNPEELRDFARSRYSWDTSVARYSEIIACLCETRKKTKR